MNDQLTKAPMVASDEIPDRPDEQTSAEIRSALERVLASDAFRSASQLTAFLTFVVERTLAGGAGELKGYTIAVEAFGRPPDFDPQADPIVRVEAGRLRKALMQYYASEGAGETVRITIPVGGYVPSFTFEVGDMNAAPCPPAATVDPARFTDSRDPAQGGSAGRKGPFAASVVLVLAVLVLAVLALATGLVNLVREPDDPATTATGRISLSSDVSAPPTSAATDAARLPILAVTVEIPPGEPALADLMDQFSRNLVDTMSRFDDLITVLAPPIGADAVEAADYVFEMSATRGKDSTDGFVRLRAVRDGRIVWSSSATRAGPGGFTEVDLVERARQLAISLVEPFGVIHADLRQFATAPAQRCLFQALDVRRTMREADHLAARLCLEGVLARDPGFHPAWSQLALLILDEHQNGFNPQPGSSLDRALAAAVTALRLAPSSARAQQVLMDVRFARGALEDAIVIGRSALQRNPYDPAIMADLGSRFVRLNRPGEGLPLLTRAIELSPGRPAWYDFYAFLAARLLGADRLSQSFSAALMADTTDLSLLGRALVAASAGDRIEVAARLRELTAASALFALDPRLYLTRKGFTVHIADRIIADLGVELLNAAKPQ